MSLGSLCKNQLLMVQSFRQMLKKANLRLTLQKLFVDSSTQKSFAREDVGMMVPDATYRSGS